MALGIVGILTILWHNLSTSPDLSSKDTSEAPFAPTTPSEGHAEQYAEREDPPVAPKASSPPEDLAAYFSDRIKIEPIRTKEDMAKCHRYLNEYLKYYKNNDLQGLSRRLLVDVLSLVAACSPGKVLRPIAETTAISFLPVEFKTIPIEAIQFLYPDLTTIYLHVTGEADLSALLQLPSLEEVLIRGSEIVNFPYSLSGLPDLVVLSLIDTGIGEISFKRIDRPDRRFLSLEALVIYSTTEGRLRRLTNVHYGMPSLMKIVTPKKELEWVVDRSPADQPRRNILLQDVHTRYGGNDNGDNGDDGDNNDNGDSRFEEIFDDVN